MKFTGDIQSGKVVIYDRESYDKLVAKLEGKRITLSLDKIKNPRSLDQNSYYFGVMIATLAKEFGYREDEKDDIHEALKRKFLKRSRVFEKGNKRELVEFAKSTTALDTLDFEKYTENIRIWAAVEFGIRIPLPNEI